MLRWLVLTLLFLTALGFIVDGVWRLSPAWGRIVAGAIGAALVVAYLAAEKIKAPPGSKERRG